MKDQDRAFFDIPTTRYDIALGRVKPEPDPEPEPDPDPDKLLAENEKIAETASAPLYPDPTVLYLPGTQFNVRGRENRVYQLICLENGRIQIESPELIMTQASSMRVAIDMVRSLL